MKTGKEGRGRGQVLWETAEDVIYPLVHSGLGRGFRASASVRDRQMAFVRVARFRFLDCWRDFLVLSRS